MYIYQKISKFLHPYVAQYLLFQMRYSSLICSKKWLNKRPDCGGMFLRLEGMTVLELCEDRGWFSLSGCHLAVNQNWAGFHTSFERGESGLSADIWIWTFDQLIGILWPYFGMLRGLPARLNILVYHSVTCWSTKWYHMPDEREHLKLSFEIWLNNLVQEVAELGRL